MGVGKSCLLHQFTEKKFMADCPHTIGVVSKIKSIHFLLSKYVVFSCFFFLRNLAQELLKLVVKK